MDHESTDTSGIDVRYVANLARLHLTDAEIDTFQGQLSQIVDYVQTINQLDLTGIAPTSHAHPLENVFRADEVKPSLDRAEVMRNAPQSRDGQFIVPKIVE
ncbi:MAG: Asp-tRNA(Asn)/Glu-tRNA(Gln) amidotransferase subunit GatC [Lentisphaerae bacterium]|nr:Asp-tRNA(Asn)/Glu-tRNA(Gln) amidotransferase subunit GatC [Lentisphaerota bacterium]